MKTKENSKRVLLTDEELMGVVGGLVQIENPTSTKTYDPTQYGCENAKTKKECKKLYEQNGHCDWRNRQCKFARY